MGILYKKRFWTLKAGVIFLEIYPSTYKGTFVSKYLELEPFLVDDKKEKARDLHVNFCLRWEREKRENWESGTNVVRKLLTVAKL